MSARTPLWKRAVWHGLKHLFRRHPVAAVSAAGAGLAYAGKEIAQESAEAMREAVAAMDRPAQRVEHPRDVVRMPAARTSKEKAHEAGAELTDADRQAFWDSLSPAAQEALKHCAGQEPEKDGQ